MPSVCLSLQQVPPSLSLARSLLSRPTTKSYSLPPDSPARYLTAVLWMGGGVHTHAWQLLCTANEFNHQARCQRLISCLCLPGEREGRGWGEGDRREGEGRKEGSKKDKERETISTQVSLLYRDKKHWSGIIWRLKNKDDSMFPNDPLAQSAANCDVNHNYG